MPSSPCPHCSAVNPNEASFCAACGKALPGLAPSAPKFVDANDQAATRAGRSLQAEELRKALKKATGALLAVAILQCLFGVLLIWLGPMMLGGGDGGGMPPAVFIAVFSIAAIFFGLYLWARRNPLPAAICGLVVFVTVHLLDALADPTAIVRGIFIKIIIILVLARAISAGARYRKLQREQLQG